MQTLSKVVISSSLVLGAALFSLGCGDGESCCSGSTPPVAAIASLSKSLPAGTSSVTVNGAQGVSSTDDGTIVNYEWVVLDDCDKQFEDGVVQFEGVSNPTLPLTPGNNNICLRVTDNDGYKDTTCSCVEVKRAGKPNAEIAGFETLNLSENCPLPTLNANNSGAGENATSINTYAWTIDGTSVGGNTSTLDLQTYKSSLGEGTHPVCLTVRNNLGDVSEKACEDVVISHCKAPENASIKLWNDGVEPQTGIPAGETLVSGNLYKMSCAADPACPATTERSDLACIWSAKSILVANDGSETLNPNVEGDCFSAHSTAGTVTHPEGVTNIQTTDLRLCSDTTTFNTVEITLTVKDPNCDRNTTSVVRYNVQ